MEGQRHRSGGMRAEEEHLTPPLVQRRLVRGDRRGEQLDRGGAGEKSTQRGMRSRLVRHCCSRWKKRREK